MLSSESNLRLGYYKVGEQLHLTKVPALIDGTNRNIHPEWIFNNEAFNKVNWTVEPTESITELYRQKALRLREKYDYLILMYSGGSDSRNILKAFLDNNIKLDEVLTVWGTDLKGTYTPDQFNFDYSNMPSEWDFSIKPSLDWIAANHPEVKITIHDWTQGVVDYKVEDGFMTTRNHNLCQYADMRWNFSRMRTVNDTLEKIENTGIIIGSDKPLVCINDGTYCIYFLDILASRTGPQFSAENLGNNLHVELFYWSPDSTQILAKQAHLIVKFFEANPAFKAFIQWPNRNPAYKQFYEMVVRAVLYPTINLDFFQVEKPKNLHFGPDAQLFQAGISGLKDKIITTHAENLAYLETIIDSSKYMNTINGVNTLKGMISPMWKLKNTST